jgi:hypothetical protein
MTFAQELAIVGGLGVALVAGAISAFTRQE